MLVRLVWVFTPLFLFARAAPPTSPAPTMAGKPTSSSDAVAAQTQPSEIAQKQGASIALMTASIDKQKTAVQVQGGKAVAAVPAANVAPGVPAGNTFFTTTWTTPAVLSQPQVIPTCTALADEELKPLVEASAKSRNLQVALVRSVIKHESDSYPCAVSDKGALGLMQLMPDVAEELGVDPLDPKQNIEGGTKYLKQLLDRYKGDVKLALAAYNAGPQRVDAEKKVPDIPETVAYVDAILKDLTQNPISKKQ